MFKLDNEIEAWCRTIIANKCAPGGVLDELKDHMYCLVEEFTQQGKSEEEAFLAAIKQMGDSKLITEEYSKNKNLLQKIAVYENKMQRYLGNRFTARQLGVFQIAWALCCAGLMMLVSAISSNEGLKDSAINWMLLVWFIPFVLAAAAPQTSKCEYFFKRMFQFR